MPAEPRITLLGPQRNPTLPSVVETVGLKGRRFATITAGWRDREGDDALLTELLGGQTVNLRLWALMQELWEADPELAVAERARRRIMTEMHQLYVIGLEQAVEAQRRILAHETTSGGVHEQAMQDIMEILRGLDDRHRRRMAELQREFYARHAPQHRPAVVQARFLVGRRVAECDAVVITGGHIGVLLDALHLLNLMPALAAPASRDEDGMVSGAPQLYRPVIAWGAGAISLTERVVLFYDDSVAAPGIAEVMMDGLGLSRGLVALPNASDRLEMTNRQRLHTLASRCAPLVPLLLDEGAQVTLTPAGELPTGARVLGRDGRAVRHDRDRPDAGPVANAADGTTGAEERV